MALPLTNLTLHCKADVNTKLSKTFTAGSGPAGDTPSDGDLVQGWDDEGDGIADVALRFASLGNEPRWRSTAPLMKNPCLDFDGASDAFQTKNQAGDTNKTVTNFWTNTAFTTAFAFYPESVTLNNASAQSNHNVFRSDGTSGADFGVSVRNNSGTIEISGYHRSGGSIQTITATGVGTAGKTWIVIFKHESGNLKLIVIDNQGGETIPTDVTSGNSTELDGMAQIGGTVAFLDGRIGEFAFYSAALTGTDLDDLKQYFKNQWLTLGAASTTLNPSGPVMGGGVLRGPRTRQYVAMTMPFNAPTASVITPEYVPKPEFPVRPIYIQQPTNASLVPQHEASEGSTGGWRGVVPDWIARRIAQQPSALYWSTFTPIAGYDPSLATFKPLFPDYSFRPMPPYPHLYRVGIERDFTVFVGLSWMPILSVIEGYGFNAISSGTIGLK